MSSIRSRRGCGTATWKTVFRKQMGQVAQVGALLQVGAGWGGLRGTCRRSGSTCERGRRKGQRRAAGAPAHPALRRKGESKEGGGQHQRGGAGLARTDGGCAGE
eukprot:5806208-Pyramimonas_sp.AAC.1